MRPAFAHVAPSTARRMTATLRPSLALVMLLSSGSSLAYAQRKPEPPPAPPAAAPLPAPATPTTRPASPATATVGNVRAAADDGVAETHRRPVPPRFRLPETTVERLERVHRAAERGEPLVVEGGVVIPRFAELPAGAVQWHERAVRIEQNRLLISGGALFRPTEPQDVFTWSPERRQELNDAIRADAAAALTRYFEKLDPKRAQSLKALATLSPPQREVLAYRLLAGPAEAAPEPASEGAEAEQTLRIEIPIAKIQAAINDMLGASESTGRDGAWPWAWLLIPPLLIAAMYVLRRFVARPTLVTATSDAVIDDTLTHPGMRPSDGGRR